MNVILVHGGMVGGWYWKHVKKELERENLSVFSPTLTGLGEKKHLLTSSIDLNTHILDIVNFIHFNELNNCILVGHSYGGMVITGVADQIGDKIKHLIYLDALIPQHNECMFDLISSSIKEYLIQRANDMGDGQFVPPHLEDSYPFDQKNRQWVHTYSTAQSLKTFSQPLSLNHSLKNFTLSFIKCTGDHALDSMLERAKRLRMDCHLLNSDHYPMVSQPLPLAKLLYNLIKKSL
ncbi:MAG: hypothetical protein BGO10_00605 [Chlamydia sp. 32-24]|nr:MAG: hypothetical protein BGO10_00605 [Chlamydia sp. 32-24]